MILIIKLGAVFLFFSHIFSTCVYLLPNNYLKKYIGRYVHAYMDTFFYQNWHLFSPNPGVSYKRIWLKCEYSNAVNNNWIDPLEALQRKHETYRILYYGKLLYYYKDIIDSFDADIFIQKNEKIILKDISNLNNAKFYFFLKRFCNANKKEAPLIKVHLKTAIIDPFPISKKDEMGKKPFYKFHVSPTVTIIF